MFMRRSIPQILATVLLVTTAFFLLTSCSREDSDGLLQIAPTTDLQMNALDLDDIDAVLSGLLDENSQGEGLGFFKLPDGNEWHMLPQDPANPLTAAKIQLGRALFHETALGVGNIRLEGYETYSCASCHYVQAGFKANLPQGIGEGGAGFGEYGEGRAFVPDYDCNPDTPDCQPVRSPTALNCAYQELMLWNGALGGVGDNLGTEANWTIGSPLESNFLGLQGVETQAHAGLLAHRMLGVENSRIGTISQYQQMFRRAYPDQEQPVNRLNVALAIAAYERTLVANEAPFQKWLDGHKNALSERQKRGAIVFFGKAGCARCHTGPALSSMTFHALGMKDLDGSYDGRINLTPFGGTIPDGVRKGRGGFTGNQEEMYRFKTPQLYNLVDAPYYGHGASMATLHEVVNYLNAAVPENSLVPPERLSTEFAPLGLTVGEVADLVAFLEEGLYDANLKRYVPHRLPSGNCFPVNDDEAQLDLDCHWLTNPALAERF